MHYKDICSSTSSGQKSTCDSYEEYFIETFDILCDHLVDIFNAILDTGNFPVQ